MLGLLRRLALPLARIGILIWLLYLLMPDLMQLAFKELWGGIKLIADGCFELLLSWIWAGIKERAINLVKEMIT